MPNRLPLLLFLCTWPLASGRGAASQLDRSLQCVVVLTEDWTSTSGVMRRFDRNGAGDIWQQSGTTVPVMVGKKGLGVGRGLVRLRINGAPAKKEGDEKAPAGIFTFRTAFGYAPAASARWVKLPYLASSKSIEAIDDPQSRFYNKLVDRSKVAAVDWRTSEKMRRDDILYKWGIVIDHNAAAIPGAGSCIFFHIWESPMTPTTGCTALAEKELVGLISWLDPARRPVLIQMPRESYRSIQGKYGLPPERP